MSITRQQVADIQKEVAAAIAPILAKHGLAIKKNTARYDSFSCKVALEMAVTGPQAEAEAQRMRFGSLFKDYGVDFDTKVTDAKGVTYTVYGFKRNGKLEARSMKDGKIWHAEPKFFRLNGVPLKAQWEKDLEARTASRAAEGAVKK